ncbi:MAG TPA: DUF748 domain-containing protein, partial [Tepidisphaeraceae bacterium]|nr:DUF748 domain-containing protein [Tepidisphaeraceae bacterium]
MNAEEPNAGTEDTRRSSPEEEKAGSPPTPSKRPRGKWRRRLVRGLLAAIALALAFRVALAILLPTVLHKTARQFGFDLNYRRLDLNLLGTQAGIWGLSLRPTDEPDTEVLHTDYAFANLSSLALFKLKLVAYRLEADGVQVNVVRKPDGSIPLLDRLKAALASDAPPPDEPLRFESPLRVEAVRLQHVNVDVSDESVSPPFCDTLTMNLRVSDVGEAGKPVTLDAELYSRSMLDALRVRGEVKLLGDGMEGRVEFGVHGLRMKEAQAYLASLGVQSGDLPLGVAGAAELSLNTLPSKQGALAGAATVSNVRLVSGADEAVRLERAEVPITELSPSTLHLGRVTARGGRLRLRRTPEGLMTFAGISPARTGAAAAAPPAPASRPSNDPASMPTSQPAPFAWRLDELLATDLAGEFRDELVSPQRRLEARVNSFQLKNVASSGGKDDVATLALALTVPDVASDLRVEGTAHPFADTPAATVVFDATGVRPDALRPYLAPLGLEPTLVAGRFHATLEATAADLAAASPRVGFKLRDVRLDDGDKGLLNMPSVSVSGLRRDPATGAIEVAEVAAEGPALTIRRLDANTLELPAFRYRRVAALPNATQAAAGPVPPTGTPTTAPETAPATRPAVARAALPIVRVNKLTWGGARLRLEDHSTTGAEPIDLSDAQLELTGFVLDLRPDAPASPPGRITG